MTTTTSTTTSTATIGENYNGISNIVFTDNELMFMGEAIKEAEKALHEGEVPVGCVIVHNGKIISRGSNKTNIKKNGTRHAEFEAIDNIFLWNEQLKNQYKDTLLEECELYVTVEPCVMCAAALQLVKIKKVYFGCQNDKFGGNGSVFNIHTRIDIENGRPYESISNLEKEKAISLLQMFYLQENKKAPIPNKRKRVDIKELKTLTFSGYDINPLNRDPNNNNEPENSNE
ncbi:adenosine deaminase [Tieghemostelium lacteum]|uniref:Adenosine deaminase n=1 Tax=Tieghemostelium lacteum TaxID=361077 RepID=A0A151ZKG2_TIELA|nr:adenosine deaminase [Tieghemostelium lacteum]|eukprot:KYQ94463.1 adenosine deaminase [Tieghemostelium lacteum]